MTARPDSRRPALALIVAGVLALVGPLVTGGSSARDGAELAEDAAAGPVVTAATSGPDCDESDIVDSLRPLDGEASADGSLDIPAGSTMADIVERGQLVVGVDQGKYRVGYRNPLTGELEGTDIDIVRQIAIALFGDPSKVKYVVLAIADRVPAIEERQVDMVVNSFAVTCERQRSVDYSSAYLTAKMRILVPVGSGVEEVEDLAGQSVCTSRGSTTEQILLALPVDLRVVTKPGIPDCMVELHRGRVAAVSSDDVLLAGLAAQDPQSEVVGRDLLTTEYAVGLSPETPDLVRFVNAVLEQGRLDGSLQASNERWLGGFLDPVPATPAARYRD